MTDTLRVASESQLETFVIYMFSFVKYIPRRGVNYFATEEVASHHHSPQQCNRFMCKVMKQNHSFIRIYSFPIIKFQDFKLKHTKILTKA